MPAWSSDDDLMSDGMASLRCTLEDALFSYNRWLRFSQLGFREAWSSVKNREDGVRDYICCCASCRLCSISAA
jgi:hypothetical protein